MNSLILTLMVFVLSACTAGNCRQNNKSPMNTEKKGVEVGNPLARVKVFKYDGSLQCGMGEAISIENMQKQLKEITVYSAANKHDGLMHIQQCGTNTGQANVYEIDQSNLDKAIALGFKQWTFD